MFHSIQRTLLVLIVGNFFFNASYAQEDEVFYRKYHFSEEPVKANADYSMVMEWDLKATVDGTGELEINGQQTALNFSVRVEGNTLSFVVYFEEDLSSNNEGLKKGDILFSINRTDKGLVTTWGKLKPRLIESEQDCMCFVRVDE